MSNNQPRDTDGKFVQVATEEIEDANGLNTVGEIDEEHVTSAIDWVNVTVEYLEEAIKRVDNNGVVRLGTFNNTYSINEDREGEIGMAALKSKPDDERLVLVAGRRREYDK